MYKSVRFRRGESAEVAKRSAFTLIELLIVVAIISILASIAVPNFLEAQVRAKVSRNRADMRTIGVALELYRLDCNHYPPDRYYYLMRQTPPMDGATADQSLWLHVLTTPVAYLTSIPDNLFANPLFVVCLLLQILQFWATQIHRL